MRVLQSLSLVCLACVTCSSIGGPLTPPGAPSPTMKTLDEVEPRIAVNATNTPAGFNSVYEISQPGSYYLSHNIVVPSGDIGIRIASADVTLDLNGYTIEGQAGSLSGILFISVDHGVIRNGQIRGMSGSGISGLADFITVEDVKITDCLEYGIDVDHHAVIRNCKIDSATDGGIRTANQSLVENCVVTNTLAGTGIATGLWSRVEDCVVEFSNGDGITVRSDSYVVGCHVYDSGGKGVVLEFRGTIRDTSILFSDGWGLELEIGSSAFNCVINQGASFGIVGRTNTTISDCVVSQNGGSGISVESRSKVIGNTVNSNTYSNYAVYVGIFAGAGATDCVIKDNDMMANGTNLNITGTNCSVVRNTSLGGIFGGIVIGAGNVAGAIVADPALAGPWDNIDN